MKQIIKALVISSLALGAAYGGIYTGPSILGTGVVISNSLDETVALTLYETTLLADTRHDPANASPTLNETGWGITALPAPHLGSYDVSKGDELFFNGGGLLSYEYVEGDIEQTFVYYKINDGGFQKFELSENEDLGGGEKRWYSEAFSEDLLDGLDNGTHTISVYYEVVSATEGTLTEDNGGDYFVAKFEAVPEPAVMGLMLFAGMSTLFIRRLFLYAT